jgi:nucleoid-associated protein YgaU
MRKEVKIAMVLVLIGIVVSAIYFFSSSEKNIEVKPPKPLSPVVTTNDNITPVTAAPEPTPAQPAPVSAGPEKKEVKGEASKPIWTINLEPLNGAPASRPVVRQSIASHEKKRAEIESAANKVTANQPVKLNAIEPLGSELSSAEKKEGKLLEGTETLTSAGETTHVVKGGETLYQIAKKYYGDGTKWQAIVKANPTLKPERMHVGQKLVIPNATRKTAVKETASVTPTPTPAPIAGEKSSTTKAAASGTTTGSTRTYKVRYGDTLKLIAEEQLGSSARWKDILKVNKDKLGGDPKRLRANSVIRLPQK